MPVQVFWINRSGWHRGIYNFERAVNDSGTGRTIDLRYSDPALCVMSTCLLSLAPASVPAWLAVPHPSRACFGLTHSSGSP